MIDLFTLSLIGHLGEYQAMM